MDHETGMLALAGLVGLVLVLSALYAPGARRARAPKPKAGRADRWRGRGDASAPAELTALLFSGERLVDASPLARHLLESGPPGLPDWPRLMAVVARRFPAVDGALSALGAHESVTLAEPGGSARLVLQRNGVLLRVVLEEGSGTAPAAADLASGPKRAREGAPAAGRAEDAAGAVPSDAAALSAELAVLRQMAEAAPMLAWQEDAAGKVHWANGAYLDAVAATLEPDEALGWPIARLFNDTPGPAPERRALSGPHGAAPRWFDVSATQAGHLALCYALPADDAARAETALARFTQTLSRTFADLPTGIAIFDQARSLVLFNPALIDICLLDPVFLSGRPQLEAVLDALRERRMVPEPRDYKAWRGQIAALERAAREGAYRELWPLIDGRTLRVTGRPHGDGALAFLIEDVTAEMAFSRRARGDTALNQAVLDSFDEAVAVFAADGAILMANRAYLRLWHHLETGSLPDTDFEQALALWCRASVSTPALESLRAGSLHGHAGVPPGTDGRSCLPGMIALRDGRRLRLRWAGLAGGARLVGFAPLGEGGPGLASPEGPARRALASHPCEAPVPAEAAAPAAASAHAEARREATA